MPLITAAQIARVASRARPHVVNAIVDHAGDVLPRYGIVTPLRLQHFLSQVMVESGYLRALEEDLSYTVAQMRREWPHRFTSDAAAAPYAHRPQALADLVYGHRMGNRPGTDDGWAFRGLGMLQNTGHDGRVRLGKVLGATPDQVSAMLVDDAWMLECAAADFVALGCLPHADRDDLAGVTRCVNGGLSDLAQRRAALKLCARVWTPRAVIDPAALVPTPAPPFVPPPPGASSMNPADSARLIDALERIAESPQAAAVMQRVLAGAAAGVGAAPATGWLAGKKTYIVAGIGVVSTLLGSGYAMLEAGGNTPSGWMAAVAMLVGSAGFATLRAGVQRHGDRMTDLVLGLGQSVALAVAAGQAKGAADTPLLAGEAAIGAVAEGLGLPAPQP